MRKAAVFILLGQSNAVGHRVPMTEEDKITTPLKNVFGLHRQPNQSFDITALTWSGYTSAGMNLGETQDDTYSVANCLASQWQAAIDDGAALPDLYIVQIAIGGEGVMDGYMWHPDRQKKLIPGKLGTVDISLYPLTAHILSLLPESLRRRGLEPEYLGIHWRGCEGDMEMIEKLPGSDLQAILERMLEGFYAALGAVVPVALHRLVCDGRAMVEDAGGSSLRGMHFINRVYETLARQNDNIRIFDVRDYPGYMPEPLQHGIFAKDMVHFLPEVNIWVAQQILNNDI